MTTIDTSGGYRVSLIDPKPETIQSYDIGIALTRLARFCGQTSLRMYSVAAHSMLVSEIVERAYKSKELALAALLHDAHEAYIGDITNPMKAAIKHICYDTSGQNIIDHITAKLDAAIASKYDLEADFAHRPEIKQADKIALRIEWECFMTNAAEMPSDAAAAPKLFEVNQCAELDWAFRLAAPHEEKPWEVFGKFSHRLAQLLASRP